jgi:MFS family permease
MAPYSGALADRFDRRMLNVASAVLSAIITGLLALLTWRGLVSLPAVLVLSLAFGFSFVFQMTLRTTLVPSLVPPAELLNAVSLFQVATQGAQFLGPALATPILAGQGAAPAWALCAVLYTVSAGLSLLVGERRPSPGQSAARHRLRDSLKYLRARPLAWAAILAVAVHCSLTMAYPGMLPMFVNMDLGAGPSIYGLLLSAIGLGAVLGSLILAGMSARRYRPALFLISLVGSGASLTAMALAPSVSVALVAGFFVGSTQAAFMSMTLALIQSSVEDEFRGRATSLFQMITLAPMAVFGWGMGGLADITQPRPLMAVSGVAFLIGMAVYAILSTPLKQLFSVAGWGQNRLAIAP